MRRGSGRLDESVGPFSVTVQHGEHFAEHLYGPCCDRVYHKLKVRSAGAGHRLEVAADVSGRSLDRPDRTVIRIAHEPPGSTGQGDQHRRGGGDLTRHAPSLHGRLVDAVADGGESLGSIAVVAPPDIPGVDMRQPDAHHAWAG